MVADADGKRMNQVDKRMNVLLDDRLKPHRGTLHRGTLHRWTLLAVIAGGLLAPQTAGSQPPAGSGLDGPLAVDEVSPLPAGDELPGDQNSAAFSPTAATPTATAVPAAGGSSTAAGALDVGLRFNFSRTEWSSVLEWIAEEAGLSLQVDRYPAGTLTYLDTSRSYTLGEAMDVVNRSLMDRGYALVRRGRQLILIDLEAENAAALISELAELVPVDELDVRGNSDIVRCVFPLGSLSAEAARTEIGQLVGPAGRVVVLESARQVIVTDTVSRLKSIRTLLQNAAQASSDVTEIVLQHRVADELLEIARPLIGLDPGANANDKIRIATGLYGDRLYVTGDAATRALLERVIERADTPLPTIDGAAGEERALPRLETYTVSSVKPETAMDVLQTLLAGTPDTRLALDPQVGGVIAYARPETHTLIRETLDKLEGRGSTFEIIQLRRLEPSQALATINKFYGVTADNRKDAPTIDGDPATGRLWVRGTPEQIEVVRNLIDKLEDSGTGGQLGDRIRVLPYTGRSAEETVQQLEALYRVMGKDTRIRMMTPAGGETSSSGRSFPQRRSPGLPNVGGVADEPSPAGHLPAASPIVPGRESSPALDRPYDHPYDRRDEGHDARREPAAAPLTLVSDTTAGRDGGLDASLQPTAAADRELADRATVAAGNTVAADNLAGDNLAASDAAGDNAAGGNAADDVVITMTPRGMVITSNDPAALQEFEQMMRTLSDQTVTESEPTVFWLTYITATDAADLITRVLGGESPSSGGGGGLAGSMLGEIGGGMLGGLLGLGGGSGGGSVASSVLTATGSVSIVPDGRLNALIVQANPVDMQMIEMILEVVDRQESPEDVRTTAKPQLIPVIYQDANDVATIIKGIYADRSAEQRSGGGGGGGQISPQDLINALRGGGGGRGGRGGGGGGGNQEPTKPAPVLIAVDARSNSLVVTAPPQDVADIRELVEALDAGSEDTENTVEIVPLAGTMKPDIVRSAIGTILGSNVTTSTAGAPVTNTPAANANANPGSSNEDIQRRIEMFRQMRQRGVGGAAGGFQGGNRGGAAPGGNRGGQGGGRGR